MPKLPGIATNMSNERKSATLSAFQKGISDAVSTRTPTLDWLKKRKVLFTGGTERAVRFLYKRMGALGENTHVSTYSYYSQLTTAPKDTIKVGAESITNFNVPISISHQEEDENSGQYQEFDRVKQATEEAMDNLAYNLELVAWGAAGGDQSELPTSIVDIVSAKDAGTIHGLSKASNTWLYSQYHSTTDPTTEAAVGDCADFLLDAFSLGYNKCIQNSKNGVNPPDGGFVDMDVFNVLQTVMPPYLAINRDGTSPVDIGFPKLVHMGVPITWANDLPAYGSNRQAFLLNSKFFEWSIRSQNNFRTTKFYDMMPDQAADIAQLLLSCCIVCNNPRSNWVGRDITL